jgi:hypothetical protein
MENSIIEIDGEKRPMTAEEIAKYLEDAQRETPIDDADAVPSVE